MSRGVTFDSSPSESKGQAEAAVRLLSINTRDTEASSDHGQVLTSDDGLTSVAR